MKNKLGRTKKFERKYVLSFVALVVLIGIGVGAWYMFRPEPSSDYTFDPNFKRTTGERIADVSNRKVKNFEQCKAAGGALRKPNKDDCYYSGVIYPQLPRKELESVIPPRYLRDYYDCMGGEGLPDYDNLSCKSWVGITFYYRGPKITNYEECTKWSGGAVNLIINPPCIAPDGMPFTRY
jgi:hypothetical protein